MQTRSPLIRIRASAGSGKTYTLTRRFLDLLRQADDTDNADVASRACAPRTAAPALHRWPEILAITFTNRAALEMRERIIHTLKSMALGQEENVPEHWTETLAASWLHTILRRFGSLNVRTIDSLLHMIVRLSALELGLPPNFEPVFNENEALAPLLDDILEQSRHDPELAAELHAACQTILLHTPDKGFLLGSRLRDRVLPLVLLMSTSQGAPSGINEVTARLQWITATLRHAAHALKQHVEKEKLPLSRHALGALETCLACDGSTPLSDTATLRKPELDDWLLASGKGKGSEASRAAYGALHAAVTVMVEEGNTAHAALQSLPYVRLAWRASRLLPDYLQGQPSLPARLIPGLAQQVLESGYGISEAFCRMGASLTHLLIDEFQDTSREQWAALAPLGQEALARGGSLTWVGDVKQAIYSWRGGDPLLFDELQYDPALLALAEAVRTDTLPTNHRSASAVVRANNSIFTRLAEPSMAKALLCAMLPAAVPATVIEATAKRVSEAFQDVAQLESGKPGGYVRLEMLDGASKDELGLLVSARLVELVRDITRRRPPGDIGILVRGNTQANAFAEQLLREGIAVVTENSLLLAEHPLIIQCIAFLEWLDAPQDDIALWTLLSGPGLLSPLGIPRGTLEDWLAQRDFSLPLVHTLRRAFEAEWNLWLAPFHSQAGLVSPYDAIREMLRVWAVQERLPDAVPFVQRFLEIVHQAEHEGCTSVASFLAYWREQGTNEKAPMPDSVDAVRIMTIHKSKGLQFPVVLIPGHNFTVGRNSGEKPVAVRLNTLNVFLPLSKAPGVLHHAAQADIARENLNLLYVAWTRAEEELYALITTHPNSKKQPGLTRALPHLLENLPSPWKQEKDGAWTVGNLEPTANNAEKAHAASSIPPETAVPAHTSLPEASAAWRPMAWLPRLKIFRNDPDTLFFSARRRGTFTHACLEYFSSFMRSLPDDVPLGTAALRELLDEAVTVCRRLFPMPVPDEAIPPITENLFWFFSLPEAKHWLRHGTPEQSLVDADGSAYRPDLLVPDYTHAPLTGWTVIEYKTGREMPEHAEQVKRYTALLHAISGCHARGQIIYLDERTIRTVEHREHREHRKQGEQPL